MPVAREIGIARNTLYRWLHAFEIEPEDFR